MNEKRLDQQHWFLRLFFISVCLLSQIPTASADLILSAPPRETPEAGKALYQPLADELTRLLGEKVVYERPSNWLVYQRDMRNDKYDIVFDGPHFISWRIKNHNHKAVVKLPGSLQFVIVVKADDDKVKGLPDLVGRKICGIPPPNLGTLTVYAAYKHPARQPVIVPVRGSFKKVFKDFEAGKCEGAVFRTTFYAKKLTDEQRKTTKVLHRSDALPNQGISISTRVRPTARKLIMEALTKGDRIPATKNILARFGGKAKAFEKADNADYKDHHKLIEGVIFGW